jgi:tRNA(adenine34) deaminase
MRRLTSAATNKIMPEAPIINLHSDDYFMGEALRQAAKAYEKGEVPVGAVIVREGKIIARAFNQVELLKDATAHAEMLALTQAQNAAGDWRLVDCTLYVTKEPCPMCAGAIVHTRLARVVFGAGDAKGGAAGGALNLLQFPTLNHHCAITGSVREPECRALLQNFFAEQRHAQKLEQKNGGGVSENA